MAAIRHVLSLKLLHPFYRALSCGRGNIGRLRLQTDVGTKLPPHSKCRLPFGFQAARNDGFIGLPTKLKCSLHIMLHA
ncbi:hypothetical protein [Kingella denitrificans]|jgi:hypothetical protein